VPSDRTFASPAAVNALLDGLGSAPQTPSIATALLARLTMTESGSDADGALARLRIAAGQ